MERGAGLATAPTSVVLGADVEPSVGFLHVLLAIALALRSIGARLELAFVEIGSLRVLVIDVTVPLLLSGPADLRILASGLRALPRTRVDLLVLGQITGSLEDLVAMIALLIDVHGWSILLSASHGTLDTLVRIIKAHGALEHRRTLRIIGLASSHGGRSRALRHNELSRMSILGEATLEFDLWRTARWSIRITDRDLVES